MDEKNVKHPLTEALRAEIMKLASEGDSKSGGILTPEILARIERVAKTGRDLLVSLNASPTSLAGLMKPRFSAFGNPVLGDDSGDVGQMGYMPLASSPPAENFGMVAIREIVAGLKAANGSESPVKLVEALAAAREAGLHDVAKELEGKLGIGKKEITASAPAMPVAVAKKGV